MRSDKYDRKHARLVKSIVGKILTSLGPDISEIDRHLVHSFALLSINQHKATPAELASSVQGLLRLAELLRPKVTPPPFSVIERVVIDTDPTGRWWVDPSGGGRIVGEVITHSTPIPTSEAQLRRSTPNRNAVRR